MDIIVETKLEMLKKIFDKAFTTLLKKIENVEYHKNKIFWQKVEEIEKSPKWKERLIELLSHDDVKVKLTKLADEYSDTYGYHFVVEAPEHVVTEFKQDVNNIKPRLSDYDKQKRELHYLMVKLNKWGYETRKKIECGADLEIPEWIKELIEECDE